MLDTSETITPGRLYPLAEAAILLPSCRVGKRVHIRTLHRWRMAGRLQCVERCSGGKTYYFVLGSEILRLLGGEQVVAWQGRTPAQRRRDFAAAEREAEMLGI